MLLIFFFNLHPCGLQRRRRQLVLCLVRDPERPAAYNWTYRGTLWFSWCRLVFLLVFNIISFSNFVTDSLSPPQKTCGPQRVIQVKTYKFVLRLWPEGARSCPPDLLLIPSFTIFSHSHFNIYVSNTLLPAFSLRLLSQRFEHLLSPTNNYCAVRLVTDCWWRCWSISSLSVCLVSPGYFKTHQTECRSHLCDKRGWSFNLCMNLALFFFLHARPLMYTLFLPSTNNLA